MAPPATPQRLTWYDFFNPQAVVSAFCQGMIAGGTALLAANASSTVALDANTWIVAGIGFLVAFAKDIHSQTVIPPSQRAS
jgi:hypothetical protein